MSPSKSRRRRPRKKKKSNTKWILVVALLIVVAVVVIVAYNMLGNGSSDKTVPSSNKVLLETSMGNITIQLRDDMPITTGNFKNLVQEGVYDNTIFHRVIAGFMIQGGDPTGTGYGDPSIPSIKDEFSDNNKNERGTVAMANTGDPNSGSSQFFINVVDNSDAEFDSNYPVFGKVIDGMNVVDKIAEVDVNVNDNYRPLENVTLIRAQLID